MNRHVTKFALLLLAFHSVQFSFLPQYTYNIRKKIQQSHGPLWASTWWLWEEKKSLLTGRNFWKDAVGSPKKRPTGKFKKKASLTNRVLMPLWNHSCINHLNFEKKLELMSISHLISCQKSEQMNEKRITLAQHGVFAFSWKWAGYIL